MKNDKQILEFLNINLTDVLTDISKHKYILEGDGEDFVLKDIDPADVGEFNGKSVVEVFKELCKEIIIVAPPVSYRDIIKEQAWSDFSTPNKIYLDEAMRTYETIRYIREYGAVKRVEPNGDIIMVRIPHHMTEETLDLFGVKRKES